MWGNIFRLTEEYATEVGDTGLLVGESIFVGFERRKTDGHLGYNTAEDGTQAFVQS